jgi:hypothetical protein
MLLLCLLQVIPYLQLSTHNNHSNYLEWVESSILQDMKDHGRINALFIICPTIQRQRCLLKAVGESLIKASSLLDSDDYMVVLFLKKHLLATTRTRKEKINIEARKTHKDTDNFLVT